MDRQRLLANKKEFARLTLGMFAASLPAYPLEFAYAGQAEAPEGKADVIDVKGEGGFSARLFVDAATHLPLMLSWMDKEPLIIRSGPGARSFSAGAGGAVRVVEGAPVTAPRAEGGGQPAKMSKEELDKLQKDMDAQRAEAEANRRTVEHRLYYGDYRKVGGITFPHRIQRSIDGKTTEEMLFESVKVNSKIDAGTFKTK
ncbi:MAG: hypothetical protein EHM24_32515 [Acidobacteria bacterium]|nr:MAG: hypothetical protein EHM24_32515 [Acidobacteriota bacterium]RPJ78993.1 MAG: hypothetical protein EHM13_13930 [Acidobacteriota bacterium]